MPSHQERWLISDLVQTLACGFPTQGSSSVLTRAVGKLITQFHRYVKRLAG